MKAILNKLNRYLPMKEFLNFFFITALGDYLQTEINISSLEKEISQKAVISLLGLKLNTALINERHLFSSPMKLIEGKINKLEMSLTDDKITIHLSEMTMLVMPVFNRSNLLMYQSNQLKPKTPSPESSAKGNQTLVESMINSMMQNVEISIDSICIKMLTYEVFSNTLDNPTLSLFISKISLRNRGDSQEGDFFLFNKEISLDHFCVKIDQYYIQDETLFYNACKVQDEKLLFNFYCSNNTLCAIDYNKGPGVLVSIKRCKSAKPKESEKGNETMKEQINIHVNVQRIEVIVNSTQLAQLVLLSAVCGNIYSNNSSNEQINSKKAVVPSINQSQPQQLKILGHIISERTMTISFELINILINENITAKETPKLFSFYTKELQKTIETIDDIESHFCYFEDNFFIVIINTIEYSSFDSSTNLQSSFDLNQIVVNYVEYQSKQPKKTAKLMSKKPSFMKMGSGSKLAISQMQSGGESIYQSAQSGVGNSIYESVLDSELVLIENFNKLIAYDFYSSSFRIASVDKVEVKAYANKTATSLHSITNCVIQSISIDFHFIFLFKAIKLLNANQYLSKELQKGSNQSKSTEPINQNTVTAYLKQPQLLQNEPKLKMKSQLLIAVKSFGLKLLNFKRDLSLIDTNPFFYSFFKSNIESYYLNKPSSYLNQMPYAPIDSIKSKDYLLLKLSELKVLTVSKQKDSEVKVAFVQILLNYNYYTLISFAYAEIPTISIKGKKNEFVTELAAPLKPSASDEMRNGTEVDLGVMSNKNEMLFRNCIITVKTQYDYKDGSSAIRAALNVIEDIQINCEYLLIKQLIAYSDTLMFAVNIAQIYSSYCTKVNSSLIEKLFALFAISKVNEQKAQAQSNTNVFITMDLDNLTVFLNKNNTIGKEGNLLKLIVNKVTSNAAFRYDQATNEAEIDINSIQLLVKKSTKPKGDTRQSHTSLIKKMNNIIQDDDSSEYILLLSKTGEAFPGSIKPSMVSLHVYFSNEPNNKESPSIEKQKLTEENCYQLFLLQNQLAMPDMAITSKLIINDCYINLVWFDFDLKANGLSFFIEETEEEGDNDQVITKELIPLCEDRKIDLVIAIELQKIYFDLFFASSIVPKKGWMRMIMVLSFAKLKQKEDTSEIKCDQCRFFFLNDFDYKGVEALYEKDNNILNVIEDIGNETSYLNRIGFVELCYIQQLSLTKNSSKAGKLQKTNVVLSVEAFEVFLCKDSFTFIMKFISKANDYFQSIKEHFSKDKLVIDDDIEIEKKDEGNEMKQNNIVINADHMLNQLSAAKELRKEYHVIENYCFNPNKFDKQLEEIKEIEAEEDYENLIEAQRKMRLKRKKSFDVVMGDNIEEDIQQEGDVQISGTVNAFRVYLFKGRDFAFVSPSQLAEENVHIDMALIEQSTSSMSSSQQLIIEDNYMKGEGLNKNSLVFLYQTRQRRKQRDYFYYVCFYLVGLKGDLNYFNESATMLSSSVTLSKLTIEDKVKLSKYSKILSKYNYEDNLSFCSVKLEVSRNSTDKSNEDVQLSIEAQLSPLNILIDQIALIFLIQFFQIKLDVINPNLLSDSSNVDLNDSPNVVKSSETNSSPIQILDSYQSDIGEFERIDCTVKKPKPIKDAKPEDSSSNSLHIKKVSIKGFQLNFSYNSHELSLKQLKRKNYLELLNISNITDFQVQFKGYERKELKTVNEAMNDLIAFWTNDIAKNQIVSAVLHSVAVVRPFVAIFDSVFDLVKQPVLSFRKDHSIKKGIGKGIKSFFATFTTQSLFIGEKSFKTMQKMLGAARSNTLNKDSYYKKWMYKVNEGKRKYDNHFLKK